MQISNLDKLQDTMLEALKTSYYSERTIRSLKQMLKRLREFVEKGEGTTYEELFSKYYQGKTIAAERKGRWLIGAIKRFDEKQEFPENWKRSHLGNIQKIKKLSKEFQEALAYFQNSENDRGIQETTIKVCFHAGVCLFTTLQADGIFSFQEITEDSIVGYFLGDNGKPSKSGSYRKNLRVLFKGFTGYLSESTTSRLINFLPEVPCRRKNIQYLNHDEFNKIKAVLTDGNSPLSKRNRAVGLLAMYTGLRSCDITGLRLDAIDWGNDVITITQRKTGRPLILPLTAVVGNAIYDYVHDERPDLPIPEVFLTVIFPYRKMGRGNATNIATQIMRNAGVRMEKGNRRGLHLFRHFFATEMLSQDVTLPVISEILGHSSPQSTQAYLSADFIHLKECALSIADFPIRQGVLS